jgi:hypothetical protein
MEFTIFPKAPDSKGFVRLHLFVSIKNNPGWYPTKVKVLAESWNQEDQTITRAQPEYKKLNGVLTKRRGQLQKAFDDLDYEGSAPTVDLIREKYNAIINHEISGTVPAARKKPNIQLFEYWDMYVDDRRKTCSKGYLRVFKAPKAWLMAFNPNLRFQDITSQFYHDFVNYLIDEGEIQNNTISTYLAKLVSVMGAAIIDPRTKHQDIPINFKLFADMYVKPKVFGSIGMLIFHLLKSLSLWIMIFLLSRLCSSWLTPGSGIVISLQQMRIPSSRPKEMCTLTSWL